MCFMQNLDMGTKTSPHFLLVIRPNVHLAREVVVVHHLKPLSNVLLPGQLLTCDADVVGFRARPS